MFTRFLLVTVLLLLVVTGARHVLATKQTPQTAAEILALTHAKVIDGVSAQPLRNATVIVRAGRIESILTGAASAPADATVIDLQGRWLLPEQWPRRHQSPALAENHPDWLPSAKRRRSLKTQH